jgi:ADP-heptose:LPS heptosyltransferase
MKNVLVARLDNMGDVLLSGPAVRAVNASGARVTYLAGPKGAGAAALLPGVANVVVHHASWIDADPLPIDRSVTMQFVDDISSAHVDEAIVLTSFHQSPLPLALLLRMAGVSTIAAISVDYPGSLLDVRHHVSDDVHEVERALSLVGTLGYVLRPHDDGRLMLRSDAIATDLAPDGPYIVVHPGASVPARAWSPANYAALVGALRAAGRTVVVTGGPSEVSLTAGVAGRAGRGVIDLGARTSLPSLAGVVAGADAVVTGNTGTAHLAAAVQTPVVSLYAPTVPASRWRPWAVPHVLLGEQGIVCAGCRARVCPVPGHPCIDNVSVDEVLDAVQLLSSGRVAVPS